MTFKKICPKCGSVDVQIDNSMHGSAYGLPSVFECKDCGFTSSFFPEVDEKEIEEFRKKIKK